MLFQKNRMEESMMVKALFILMVISIPISVPFDFGGHQLNLPSEPLMLILALWLMLKLDYRLIRVDSFFRHPVTLVGLGYLIWMACTIPWAYNPITAAKYFVVTLGHWWVFYIGFWYCSTIKRSHSSNWMMWYAIVFIPVIFYAWYQYVSYGFRIDMAVITARPFYKDNNLYAAAVCFYIFWAISRLLSVKKVQYQIPWVVILWIFLMALFWSNSRGAWLGCFISGLLAIILIILRRNPRRLILVIGFIGLLTVYLGIRIWQLGPVQEVSKQGGWWNQVKSIANITTDVSNQERLNRYDCAWRMFKDRPWTGFGAGTYQEVYLSYQNPAMMTRLSVTTTRAPDGSPHPSGRGGGAHSEYLQALSELGGIGFLLVTILFLWPPVSIVIRYVQMDKPAIPLWISGALLCYSLHGMVNQFLHEEKIAVLFWVLSASSVLITTRKPDLKDLAVY